MQELVQELAQELARPRRWKHSHGLLLESPFTHRHTHSGAHSYDTDWARGWSLEKKNASSDDVGKYTDWSAAASSAPPEALPFAIRTHIGAVVLCTRAAACIGCGRAAAPPRRPCALGLERPQQQRVGAVLHELLRWSRPLARACRGRGISRTRVHTRTAIPAAAAIHNGGGCGGAAVPVGNRVKGQLRGLHLRRDGAVAGALHLRLRVRHPHRVPNPPPLVGHVVLVALAEGGGARLRRVAVHQRAWRVLG